MHKTDTVGFCLCFKKCWARRSRLRPPGGTCTPSLCLQGDLLTTFGQVAVPSCRSFTWLRNTAPSRVSPSRWLQCLSLFGSLQLFIFPSSRCPSGSGFRLQISSLLYDSCSRFSHPDPPLWIWLLSVVLSPRSPTLNSPYVLLTSKFCTSPQNLPLNPALMISLNSEASSPHSWW